MEKYILFICYISLNTFHFFIAQYGHKDIIKNYAINVFISLIIFIIFINIFTLTDIITKKKNKRQFDCAICIDRCSINENVGILPCKHKFHDICINKWFDTKKSCPLCRKNYQIPMLNDGPNMSDVQIEILSNMYG